MSRFIEANNQTMLWKISNKVPEFLSMYPSHKEELFKHTIQNIYDYIPNAYINDSDLHQYNCAFLSELVKNIRNRNQKEQLVLSTTNRNPVASQFEQKKMEYERMNSKPDVPNAAELFKEADEERVQNMDELIEQFEKNRKLDILPPLPVAASEISKDSVQERIDLLEKTIFELKTRIEEIEKKIP
jgi:uncharacterized protein YceH (UPF0502 family)